MVAGIVTTDISATDLILQFKWNTPVGFLNPGTFTLKAGGYTFLSEDDDRDYHVPPPVDNQPVSLFIARNDNGQLLASQSTNSAVPEPSTAIAMGLLGVVGFAGNRRRRRTALNAQGEIRSTTKA